MGSHLLTISSVFIPDTSPETQCSWKDPTPVPRHLYLPGQVAGSCLGGRG